MLSLNHLLNAVAEEDIQSIDVIFSQSFTPEIIKAHSDVIEAALMLVVSKRNTNILTKMLAIEEVQKIAAYDSNALLEKACELGEQEIVRLLLSIRAIKENAHKNKNFALIYAAKNGDIAIGRILLALPNVVKKAATAKNAALGAAAYGNHLEFVKLLLQINEVKENAAISDNHVLQAAIENNSIEVVQYLLTIDIIEEALLDDPAVIVELCKIPSLLEYVSPIVRKLEFFGFTLNQITKQNSYKGLFKTQDEVQLFFENPCKFVDSLPNATVNPLFVEALRIKAINAEVERIEQAYRGHSETAMSPRALLAAKISFEKAQKLYGNIFDTMALSSGGQVKAIEQIEQDIRGLILKKIKQDVSDPVIVAFINDNYKNLLLGVDELLMEKARIYFNSNVNINDIAWRAYDCFAPTYEWSNLFTPTKQNKKIFAAGIRDDINEVDIQEGSYDVRLRAALYYLALQDTKIQATLDKATRESIYIGQIAEIQRAHNIAGSNGLDSPSCYPGTVGRIAGMGAGHPELHMIDPIAEISNIIYRLLNESCQMEMRDTSSTELAKEKIFLALTALTTDTIDMLKAGKKLEFNLLTKDGVLSDVDIIKIRKRIMSRLGTVDSVFQLINEEYDIRVPKVRSLVEDEKVFVKRQLVDISYNSVANKVAANFRPELPKISRKAINISDPFQIKFIEEQLRLLPLGKGIVSSRKADEVRIQTSLNVARCKHAIFETVYPILRSNMLTIAEDAVATFAEIVATLKFSEFDSVIDMRERWPHQYEITESLLEQASALYQENPLPNWSGKIDLKPLVEGFKMQSLEGAISKLKM